MLLTTVLLPDFFAGGLLKWLLYNDTEVLGPGKDILWLILPTVTCQTVPESPFPLSHSHNYRAHKIPLLLELPCSRIEFQAPSGGTQRKAWDSPCPCQERKRAQ